MNYSEIMGEALTSLQENYTEEGIKRFYSELSQLPTEALTENVSLYLGEPKYGVEFALENLQKNIFDSQTITAQLESVNSLLQEFNSLESYNTAYREGIERFKKTLETLQPIQDIETQVATQHLNKPKHTHLNQLHKAIEYHKDFMSDDGLSRCRGDVLIDAFPAIINYIAQLVVCDTERFRIFKKETGCDCDGNQSIDYHDKRFKPVCTYELAMTPGVFLNVIKTKYSEGVDCKIIHGFKHVLKDCIHRITEYNLENQDAKLYNTETFIRSLNEAMQCVIEMEIINKKAQVSALKAVVQEDIMEMQPIVGYYNGDVESEKIDSVVDEQYFQMLFEESIINFAQTDIHSPQLLESFTRMVNLQNVLETIDTSKVKKGAKSLKKTVSGKASTVSKEAKDVHKEVTKINDGRKKEFKEEGKKTAVDVLTAPISAFKRMDEKEKRAQVIQGGFLSKLRKILHEYIVAKGMFFLAGPFLGAIAEVVRLVTLKSSSDAERRKVIVALQQELEFLDEEIEDCKSGDDKKRKYELMRLKNSIQKEIVRISSGQSGKSKDPEIQKVYKKIKES